MKHSLIPLLGLLIFLISTQAAANQNFGDEKLQCGVQKIAKNNVIVRGRDASPGSWPWHCAIYHRRERSENYACGGTLIGLTFVLTAKHCVTNHRGQVLPNERIFVRFGVHDLDEVDAAVSQDRNVLKINLLEGANLTNDIALLELSNRVQLSDYVQPACINEDSNLIGQFGVVAGWGVTESDKTSATLKIARMPVIGYLECLKNNRDLFGATLDDSLICAGYTNGTTVCNGDSGGGLLFKKGDRWVVGGVVAFTAQRDYSSDLCTTEGYAAFTNVVFFKSWLGDVMGLEYLTGNDNLPVRKGTPVDPAKRYPNYLPRQCGNILLNRIVNGQKARLFEYPWMAILIYPEDADFSAGTVISTRYVLTAASGVVRVTPYKVRLGEFNRDQVQDCDVNDQEECAPPVQDFRIEFIVRHHNYSVRVKHKPYDIALIRLKHEVIFSDHIQPICLPGTRELQQMRLAEYVIAGWGAQEPVGRLSAILFKARVPLKEAVECESWLPSGVRLTEVQICAGSRTTAGPCAGDSGGPLKAAVRYRGARFVQFGITSFGPACGISSALYTNVSSHMPWILANMEP